LTASGIGAVVANPFAAWWLIGDQSSITSRPLDQLEQMWQAPAISARVTAIVGAIALAIVAVAIVAWLVAATRPTIDRRWLLVLCAFPAAGGLSALIGRAVTAATVGANIGGGIALLMVPFVVVLIAYGFVQAVWLLLGRHRPESSRGCRSAGAITLHSCSARLAHSAA
jgi:hypothetical protein